MMRSSTFSIYKLNSNSASIKRFWNGEDFRFITIWKLDFPSRVSCLNPVIRVGSHQHGQQQCWLGWASDGAAQDGGWPGLARPARGEKGKGREGRLKLSAQSDLGNRKYLLIFKSFQNLQTNFDSNQI
jgi:hypothetical protein